MVVDINGTKQPALKVEILPGSKSTIENLKFKWICKLLNETNMLLNLKFDFPNLISVYPEKENLRITINYNATFKDSKGNFIQAGFVLETRQMPKLFQNKLLK